MWHIYAMKYPRVGDAIDISFHKGRYATSLINGDDLMHSMRTTQERSLVVGDLPIFKPTETEELLIPHCFAMLKISFTPKHSKRKSRNLLVIESGTHYRFFAILIMLSIEMWSLDPSESHLYHTWCAGFHMGLLKWWGQRTMVLHPLLQR